MARIDRQAFRLFLPALTDVFIRGKPFKGFESFGTVVGHQEGLEMFLELLMGLSVLYLHRRFLERHVQACSLTIRPRIVGFDQPMVDDLLMTDANDATGVPFAGNQP